MLHTTLPRVLLLALALASAPAFAGPKEDAQAHVAKATEAHQRNDFQTALTELQAAYASDPQPDLLYAIGQVFLKLDRCGEAITYYEKYLATAPTLEAAGQAQEAIDTCKAKLPPPRIEPPPPPPPSKPTPWYKDKLGDALVIGGVVAGSVGVVFYLGARSELDDASVATNLVDYNDHVDSAKSKRLTSVVLIGGGAALIGAGVLRYMLRDPGGHQESRGVGVVPTSGGGLVTWSGGF